MYKTGLVVHCYGMSHPKHSGQDVTIALSEWVLWAGVWDRHMGDGLSLLFHFCWHLGLKWLGTRTIYNRGELSTAHGPLRPHPHPPSVQIHVIWILLLMCLLSTAAFV